MEVKMEKPEYVECLGCVPIQAVAEAVIGSGSFLGCGWAMIAA